MIFEVLTTILKDSGKKEFTNAKGENVKYRNIRVMNTDTDDNVTEISVNDNFGDLPLKEPVKLTVENKEAYGKMKFYLHKVSPVDPLETENEEAEIKDN